MNVYELNMDGLVGPTHNYAGLAHGNIASTHNALARSNPQAAALQGLDKMRLLHSMGIKQGLLPPHQRPNLELLHQLGFSGTPQQQIKKAYQTAPQLLSACYSASSMWSANAATVSPSTDTQDHKVHFTAANLIGNLHRHQEADFSKKILEAIFANENYFKHHPILPRSMVTGDEGAANHNRICQSYGQPGIHLFVYGKKIFDKSKSYIGPTKYPARQTREASEAIVRQHQLSEQHVIYACQNPHVIDKGVFHNDVISVANEFVFLVHEQAFYQQDLVFQELKDKANFPIQFIQILQDELTVQESVETYLFNSQIISLAKQNSMMLLAPFECQNNNRVNQCIERILSDDSNPINSVHFLNLKQSMQNGGGPACLRLRIPLNEEELRAMHQGVLIHDTLLSTLEKWVHKHYRTELTSADLADPQLIEESCCALDELTQILQLGSIYPFQLDKTH
ncbi:succinylarginine dihydrolase [Legionella wadsworthii]|uniref:N-succinylarginine dihydrolase n=1 Tax=Legionella wadsworthii TaxID=28088 RepID=A0A378LRH4_9GAMM|nr:N-succinylarginine dihydrolase [Legionella wadsworthii]STY29354.1 succinylarginine dihydrolase [Legionella wadsworthii]